MKKEVKYDPMPKVVYSELTERKVRDDVQRLAGALSSYLAAFRENGVTITTAEQLKELTPERIKSQIADVRNRRLSETFLPTDIRKAEEESFEQMERTLLPLAEGLQDTLKSVKFTLCLDEREVYFDGDEVEAYIKKASAVDIPEYVGEYYELLQAVCSAWNKLYNWCATTNVSYPTVRVLEAVKQSAPGGEDACTLSITPEKMYRLWGYRVVHRK